MRNNNKAYAYNTTTAAAANFKEIPSQLRKCFYSEKIHVTPSTIFLRKKTDAFVWQEVFKKVASRCDRSKSLYTNKLCKKPDHVIPALR